MRDIRAVLYGMALVSGYLGLSHDLGHDPGWWGIGVGVALGFIGQWMANMDDR